MRLSTESISLIQEYFRDKPVLRAYVFGSYARGDANAESDLDLLVDLDYSQYIGFRFLDFHQELEQLLRRKIDLVASDALSPFIMPFVHRDKQLIYEQ